MDGFREGGDGLRFSGAEGCRRCTECVGQEHHLMEPEIFVPYACGGEPLPEDMIVLDQCKHCPWVQRSQLDEEDPEPIG
jgi:hypothetical protein